MGKNVFAIITGTITWWVIFIGVAFVMTLLWPELKQAFEIFPDTHLYNSSLLMQFSFLTLFVFCSIASGWITVFISKQRVHTWYVSVLLMMYIAPNHLYFSWDLFHPWYNWLVVIPVIPVIVYSGKLVKISE